VRYVTPKDSTTLSVPMGEIVLALAVEQEHSWCPDRIKAVEPCRMFLNGSFYRKETLADEFGSLLIFIRLGIQPSTGSSGRSRAEVQQDGAGLLLSLRPGFD